MDGRVGKQFAVRDVRPTRAVRHRSDAFSDIGPMHLKSRVSLRRREIPVRAGRKVVLNFTLIGTWFRWRAREMSKPCS